MFKRSPLVISVLLALSLTACGGGGSSTSSTPPTPTARTLGGASSKGIVKQGVVTAYELKADGSKIDTPVGNAVTDDKGVYSLTLSSSYTDGAILIELTADSATKLKCDALSGCGATNYGEWMDAPTDFKMTAIAPPTSTGDTVKVQVTPYSHMAAKAAQMEMSNGTSPADAVSQAVTQMNGIVGVNILTTPPVDITDTAAIAGATPEQQQYALFNAAFADVIAASGGDMQAVLDDYAAEFEDGDFDAGNADVNLNTLIAQVDAQLMDPENADLDQETKDDVGGVIAILEQEVGDDGSYDPAPTDDTAKTEVEKAKGLVQETRTWLTSFSELKSPAEVFAGDAQAVAEALGQNSGAVLESSMGAVTAILNNTLSKIKAGGSIPESSTISGPNGSILTRTWKATPTTEFTLSTENLNGVKFSYTVTLDKPLADLASEASLVGQTITGKIVGNSSNADISITLDAQLAMGFKAGVTEPYPLVETLSFNGGIKLAKQTSGVLTGDEVAGAAQIAFVSLNPGVAEGWRASDDFSFSQLSLSRLKLGDMTVKTAAGSSAGFAVDLRVDNAATFDSISFLQGGNEIWISKWYEDQDLLGLDAMKPENISYLWDAHYAPQGLPWDMDAQASWYGIDDMNYEQYVSIPGLSLEKQAQAQAIFDATWQPSQWVVGSSNWQIDYSPYGGTYVSGLLQLDKRESAEYFLDASLSLTGKLALAGHPEATASMLFDRTAQNAATASVMLSYNGHMLDIDVSKSEDAPGTGTLEVSNTTSGAKLTVNAIDGQTSGTVTVDGKQVGTITDGILRYNDGTFESLK